MFSFQALIAYILVIIPSKRNQYRRVYDFGGNFIYGNCGQSSSVHYSVCDQMAINLVTKSLIIALLVTISLGMAACVPLYKFIFTDEREFIIPIILPFIDPNASNGFYINLTNQLIICGLGGLVIPGIELITCIMKNNAEVAAKVIKSSLLDYKRELKKSKKPSIEWNREFRNIILKILDFERSAMMCLWLIEIKLLFLFF